VSKSIKSKSVPSKPRPDFPLFPHKGTNRWAKKVRGKLVYFGRVFPDDPKGEAALQKWLDQKDELLAGRKPRVKTDNRSIEDLCNLYLEAKRIKRLSGELQERTWLDYRRMCEFILSVFDRNLVAADLGPADFSKLREAFANRWGPTRIGNYIQMTRGMLSWAKQERLIPAPCYGASFRKPAAKAVREARNAAGPRLMTPEQIRKLLGKADPVVKACILLAANGGIGPLDLARLPITALDLDGAWLNYPRHKTAIPRRIPLWPETVAALREVFAVRHQPQAGQEDYLFLRLRGQAFLDKEGELIGKEFREVAKRAGVKGHGLYDLRRGFQTIGERSKDTIAVSAIMGHAPKAGDMAAVYRQEIDDDRLQAVVNVVRDWLFGDGGDGSGKDTRKPTRHEGRKGVQTAPESTPIARAVMRCLQAIAAADGQDKAVLRSVWNESEIALALSGESWTVEKFLRTWGDDRPQLRIVS
jgi:integrase